MLLLVAPGVRGPGTTSGRSEGVAEWTSSPALTRTRNCPALSLPLDAQMLSSHAVVPPLVLQMGVVSTCSTSFVPTLHAGFISPADSLLLRCFHLSWDVLFIALTLYFEALPLSRLRGLREKQTPSSSLLSGFGGLAPQTRGSSPSMAKGCGG